MQMALQLEAVFANSAFLSPNHHVTSRLHRMILQEKDHFKDVCVAFTRDLAIVIEIVLAEVP